LAAFNRRRVRYLVVGAYAVMRYSEPRYTKDLDIWVDVAPDNATRIYNALVRFGGPLKGFGPEDFEQRHGVFQMGVPPVRIDVIGHIDGVRFSAAWRKRTTSRIDGLRVHFISKEDLIRNKRASGRRQDLIDLENLA
jgi:hypothetical protein